MRFRLLRALRGGTETMVGHYHSHPDHPPLPSPHDLAMAFEPDLVWVILAVEAGVAGGLAAFRPQAEGGGFVALTVRIVAAPPARGGD